jgi:hypothetical protein
MEKLTSLGLDISTSIIGLSCFVDNKFDSITYIDLRKIKCIFKKAEAFEKHLKDLNEKFNFSKVYIEDTLQSFARGLSSARTLMQLSRFNGIVSNIVFRITSIVPVYINVNTARKQLNIKIDKNSSKDKKLQVLEWVDNDIGLYPWPKKTISRGKNKGRVKYEDFCYDMADAYVICKSGIEINEQNSQGKI